MGLLDPVDSNYVAPPAAGEWFSRHVDEELGGALTALREKVAAETKAAEVEQTMAEIREHLAERLETILGPQITAQLDRWQHKRETTRAYKSDFRRFKAWCETVQVPYLPATPEVVALYIAEKADQGLAVSTLKRIRSAIARIHELAAFSPTRSMLVSAAIAYAARKEPATKAEH